MILFKRMEVGAKLPRKQREGDAGFDLYALEDTVLPRNVNGIVAQKSVRTGIKVEIPEGFFGLVTGRSGLAFNQGIHNFNGTIDCNYRGEIKILLVNHNNIEYKVEKGDRLAQLLIVPITNFGFEEVEELSPSNRGTEGFGSSGK